MVNGEATAHRFAFSRVGVRALVPHFDCCRKDCRDFTYQQDAQTYFQSMGGSQVNNVDLLDDDHDGIACELLPRRIGASSTNSSSSPALPLPVSQKDESGLSTGCLILLLAVGSLFLIAIVAGIMFQRARRSERCPFPGAVAGACPGNAGDHHAQPWNDRGCRNPLWGEHARGRRFYGPLDAHGGRAGQLELGQGLRPVAASQQMSPRSLQTSSSGTARPTSFSTMPASR